MTILPHQDQGFNATVATVPGGQTIHQFSKAIGAGGSKLSFTCGFFQEAAQGQFESYTYNITPRTLKWSVSITNGWPFGHASSSFSISTSLVIVQTGNLSNSEGRFMVQPFYNAPQEGMTTYVFQPSSSTNGSGIITLEVFNVAQADGRIVPVNHSLGFSQNSAGGIATLNFTFSLFNESLLYDPTLSFGGLMSGPSTGGSSSSSTWVIAVAVSLLCAVLFVIASIVAGLAAVMHIKYRRSEQLRTMASSLSDNTLQR